MTAEPSPSVRLRLAIQGGSVLAALSAAAEMRRVPLVDALDLCRLMAQVGDERYPRAAGRWLARFHSETGATLAELTVAAGALAQLREEPASRFAIETLERLMSE